MKKSFFPFVVLVALMLPLFAWGTTETVDGIEWEYYGPTLNGPTDKTLTGDVVIPSTLGGYSMTTIGFSAFYGCNGLTSVTIPSCVKSIDTQAFYGCSGLTSVKIPSGVTNIGRYAFYDCSGLTNVEIPNGVTSIGNAVFGGCSGLTSIAVAAGNALYSSVNGLLLSKDGATLFCGINGDVTIPDGVTSIVFDAFIGCSSLTSVKIPNSVTNIGAHAFYGCSALTSIMIPDGVTSIVSDAFNGCSSLTSVKIPNSVADIGRYAFYGCSALTNVVIPNSVTNIGQYAFQGCIGLTSVTISDSVTTIDESAFRYCSALKRVTIPDSVKSIGAWAFDGCNLLQSVTIGNGVTSIGYEAFSGGSVVFHGGVPEGWDRGVPLGHVTYSEENGAEWMRHLLPLTGTVMDYAREASAEVEILSAQMRATDPTILDVVYKVTSTNSTVNVRALAFEDGERSFSKVVRPETFIEGTGSNLGDGIAANVEHTLSWRVPADWEVDLAKVSFEILLSDVGQLPVELVTIPAAGTNAEMTINVRLPYVKDVFNALLWHYANHAEGLRVLNGTLMNGNTRLADATSISFSAAWAYVYDKMGFDLLSGDALTYARSATRWPLRELQYGVLRADGE